MKSENEFKTLTEQEIDAISGGISVGYGTVGVLSGFAFALSLFRYQVSQDVIGWL